MSSVIFTLCLSVFMSIVRCVAGGILHGSLHFSQEERDNQVPVGTVAFINCDRGYIQYGPKSVTCVETEKKFGEWDIQGQKIACKRACPKYGVQFGSAIYSQDELPNGGYAKGTQVTIRCYSGYRRRSGSTTITCSDYGQWQGRWGSCEKSKAIFKLIYK